MAVLIKYGVLVFLLLCAGCSYADDFIMVNTVSHHYHDEENYNQQNYGFGIEKTLNASDISVQAGFYKNSIQRESVYVLAGYAPLRVEDLSVGITGGLVTGYNYAPVVPAAGVLGSLNIGKILINMIATPNVKRYGVSGFASLQVGYQFK